MNIATCEQRTPEWYALKKGRIGGTRFGQVISGRKNRLVYELLNEQLNDEPTLEDYISDDMLFGIENEPIARDLYSVFSGIEFTEVGAILSERSDIHLASPDGINMERGIVLELKCTQNGAIHLERFFEGPEKSYMPQIMNYFAVSDDVKEVHWVSYCPYRMERPIVMRIFTRAMFPDTVIHDAWNQIAAIEAELLEMKQKFLF